MLIWMWVEEEEGRSQPEGPQLWSCAAIFEEGFEVVSVEPRPASILDISTMLMPPGAWRV